MPPDRDQEEAPNQPPPPPPPQAESLRPKISPFVQKLKTAAPEAFFQPVNPPRVTDLLATPTGPYFFYGTLADPSMLREILGLESEASLRLRPAKIIGYECKLWGQYPALVDAPGSIVEGVVYGVQTPQHGVKLAEYETGHYRAEPCRIVYTDANGPEQDLGYTLKFVGDERDLSEGTSDLRVWLRRMGRVG
ncbi:gamma-glutamylcyclotransferase family protein [Aspergillus lucknowensis]|uniref:Putative gamma-glutamylcyclotransferase n=1 Tax=Aspergillus lucknowensis TaxID=176173 RepID=A0ABR4M2M7_9EURO